jgi:hypothetical protein
LNPRRWSNFSAAHQADRALLNEIKERQALVTVSLGDRDDQAKVRFDHLLFGSQRATFDLLREGDLLLGGQQGHVADLPEKQLQRVGGHLRLQTRRGSGANVRFGLAFGCRTAGGRQIDLVVQFDLTPFEQAV